MEADKSNTQVLLSTRQLADRFDCSIRHIQRLNDSGKLPRPLKLGNLIRWRRSEIENWIDGGCQPIGGAQ